MPHIVDQLIEERAKRLRQNKFVWSMVQRFGYPVLGYRRTVEVIDAVQDMCGGQVFDWLSNQLQLQLSAQGVEHLPKTGTVVVVANHPAGIADGIAVYDALKAYRTDITFFANRDAIRAAPKMADMIVPVEWMQDKRTHERTKETVKHMVRAFRDQRVIVIFPSGRLAKPTLKGLVEREWMSSAVGLAQKYQCPIVPLHITGRNSWLYYFLYFTHTELKDMMLFRELLNKQNRSYALRFAAPIDPSGSDPRQLTDRLREFVAQEIPIGKTAFTFSQTPTKP